MSLGSGLRLREEKPLSLVLQGRVRLAYAWWPLLTTPLLSILSCVLPQAPCLLLSGWCGDGRHCPRSEGWEEAGVSPLLLSCLGTVFLAGLLPPLRPGLPPHPFWCGVATASHPEPGHWVPSTPWTLTLCTLFSMAPSLLCRAPAGEAICLQTAP